MLDNPATIGEALREAAKLPFEGNDKVRFNEKRDQYIDGLTAHQLPHWVGQMKGLLSKYEDCNDAVTTGKGFRNYTFDRDNQWHYLDKKKFRERVGEICDDRHNPVKVIFIEHNHLEFSDQMHEILRSFIKEDYKEIHDILSPTEGKMGHVINFDNSEKLEKYWDDFMRKFFQVPSIHKEIPDTLRGRGFYQTPHIIIHSVGKLDSTCWDNFRLYCSFWTELCTEHPVFLCMFLPPEHSLPRDFDYLPHWIPCYCDEYETVGPFDFTCFFNDYTSYQKDENLCECTSLMRFSEAVKKLRYCQP